MNARYSLFALAYPLVGYGASSAQPLHEAEYLHCNFGPDVREAKSNQATCSPRPERTFSTSSYQHSTTEHCSSTSISRSSAFRDFRLNLENRTAEWTHEFVSDPRTRDEIIQMAMERDGTSKQEARAQFDKNMNTQYEGEVLHVEKIFDEVMWDSVLDEPLDPPRLEQALIIQMRTSISRNFTLYISENSDAIITEYASGDDYSWADFRFGRCKNTSSR